MIDEGLEELRKRKLEELQRQYSEELQEKAAVEQQITQFEGVMKQVLSKDAYMRYANIKAADPERALQVVALLAQIIQSNPHIRIDDEKFKTLLGKAFPKRREIKISRR